MSQRPAASSEDPAAGRGQESGGQCLILTQQSGTDEVGKAGQRDGCSLLLFPPTRLHGGHSVNTEEQCGQSALYWTVRGLSHAAQNNVHMDLLEILLKCRLGSHRCG